MFELKHSISIDAPESLVWSVLTGIEGWMRWNPCVSQIRALHAAPFGLGSEIYMEQPGLRPAVWKVVSWKEPHSFQWTSRHPGATITAGHWTRPELQGCSATSTLRVTGMLAWLVRYALRSTIEHYMTEELAGLKRHCELLAARQQVRTPASSTQRETAWAQ